MVGVSSWYPPPPLFFFIQEDVCVSQYIGINLDQSGLDLSNFFPRSSRRKSLINPGHHSPAVALTSMGELLPTAAAAAALGNRWDHSWSQHLADLKHLLTWLLICLNKNQTVYFVVLTWCVCVSRCIGRPEQPVFELIIILDTKTSTGFPVCICLFIVLLHIVAHW